MNSSNYFGIVGEGYNFRLKGNLTATSKFHMNLEKLILDANGPANLNTLNSDIFADIIFQSGTWDLHSTVQTARGYKIDFINGYLFANGHRVASILGQQGSGSVTSRPGNPLGPCLKEGKNPIMLRMFGEIFIVKDKQKRKLLRFIRLILNKTQQSKIS